MKILILGNSNIFQKKVLPALTKIKNLKIELASKSLKTTNIRYEKISQFGFSSNFRNDDGFSHPCTSFVLGTRFRKSIWY